MFDGRKVQKSLQSFINSINKVRTTPLSKLETINLSKFFCGLEQLGVWDSMIECWPMSSNQNAGTGTTLFGVKGYNGTIVNGPTWGIKGLTFVRTSSQYIQATIPQCNSSVDDEICLVTFAQYDISPPNYPTVLQLIQGGGSSPGFIVIAGTNILRASCYTAGTDGAGNFINSDFFYGAASFRASTKETYLTYNDQETYQVVSDAFSWNSSTIRMGYAVDGSYLDGQIAFNMVFRNKPSNFILQEIRKLYLSTLGGHFNSLDPDAVSYIDRAGITNPLTQKQISDFIIGLKNLGYWDDMVEGYLMRSSQNVGSGTTLYGLKSDTYNGSLVNGPIWTENGINVANTSSYVSLPSVFSGFVLNDNLAVFSVFNNNGTIPSSDLGLNSFGSDVIGNTRNNALQMYLDGSTPTVRVAFNGTGGPTNVFDNTKFNSFLAQWKMTRADTVASYVLKNSLNGGTDQTSTGTDDLIAGIRESLSTAFESNLDYTLILIFNIQTISAANLHNLYKNTVGEGLGLS